MVPRPVSPPRGVWVTPESVAPLARSVHGLAGEARYNRAVDILDAIRANRERHREHTSAADALDSQLRDLVKMAFEQGRTGPELAAVLGISKERVYQIRDGRR